MPRPRFSIASMILVVLVIGLDLYWIRHDLQSAQSMFGLTFMGLDFGIIPMANLLALGTFRIFMRRGRPLPFTTGFTLAGAVCWLIYIAMAVRVPGKVTLYLVAVTEKIMVPQRISWIDQASSGLSFNRRIELWKLLWVTAALNWPQFFVALLCGLLAVVLHRARSHELDGQVSWDGGNLASPQ
jgi:hypothetical protein